MDYRGITEDEQAAEHSPWGASPPATPRRNETTHSSLSAGASYGYGAQDGSNGLGQDDPTENAFGRPSTSSTHASVPDFTGSQPSEVPQQSGFGPPLDQSQQQQQQQQQAQSPYFQEQGAPQQHAQGQPQPQAGQEQQPRRQTQPQYKLQAKITGLERTGRKDPILRFDVHVRSANILFIHNLH